MRGGERLVQVQVQDVESHIAWTGHADERVHIRSIIVEKASASVDEGGDLLYVLLEESEGVRVRHHDAGDVVAQKRFEVVHVHETVCLGLNDNHFQTADSGAGRVCTVSAVRHDHLGSLQIPVKDVVLTHDHQTGQLTVGAGARIEREMGHSRDRGQSLVHIIVNLQGALNRGRRLQRMQPEEAFHPGDLLVDLRVVLHRAASQRIESGVHTEIHLGEVRVVTHDINLAHLRKSNCLGPSESSRNLVSGGSPLVLAEGIADSPLFGEFENKLIVIFHTS